MKIVHALGWYFPDSVGGTEVYVASLCRRLRDLGVEVEIAAPESDAAGVRRYVHDRVPVFRYPIPSSPTRDEAQGLVPLSGSGNLTRFVVESGADVFHVHSIVTGLGRHEMAAVRAAGVRTVLTHHLPGLGHVCRRGTLMEHGIVPCDGLASPVRCSACVLESRGMPSALARLAAAVPLNVSQIAGRLPTKVGTTLGLVASTARDRVMQRELNDACDAIVVLNDAARRVLVANGSPPAKLTVNRLGHGLSTSARHTRDRTSVPVRFGFLGRLHPTKGVYELVHAAREVPRELEFHLEIRGVIQSALEQRVRTDLDHLIDGDPRISFAEAVSGDAVPATLASYDVLCCPSTWFENGPTVAIEAMAVGTPVVGTRLGNLVELVDDGVNGRLVPAADHRALAGALEEIVNAPAIVDRWRANLRPARTMDAVAIEYFELYRGLLAPAARGVSSDGVRLANPECESA